MSVHNRIIANTNIKLTREDGAGLNFGEDGAGLNFNIYRITGLGIGEIERESSSNAMADGELWLGSRITSRILEIETRWDTALQRAKFMDFFQHNMRFDMTLTFNTEIYYGSCVLSEAYEAEQHGGYLYSGSEIGISLYFDDPYLYTNRLYQYFIGHDVQNNFAFYNNPADHVRAVPEGDDLIHYFSTFRDSREYVINNPSSTPNGIEATITAFGYVSNPSIHNITTGQQIQFNLTMYAGQMLYINTQPGFIEATLDGIDVLRLLTMSSRMIQIGAGDSTLQFNPDSGSDRADCEISFRGKVLAI